MPTNPVDSESVTLAAGESQSLTLEWTSTTGEVGDWNAEVRSTDDTAIQSVTVEAISGSAVSGTVTDGGGTPLGRVPVRSINDSQGTHHDVTETDSNGDYLFDFPTGEEAHVMIEYTDPETGETVKAESKPFIVTS